MPIIGATELQPVNILGQYMQGMEMARGSRVAQQEQQLNALRLRAAEQEQADAAALRNALAGGADEATLMGLPGGLAALEQLAKLKREQAAARSEELTRGQKAAEIVASEAGALLSNPANLNMATLDPWAQSAVQRGLITPEAYARFRGLQDDPAVLGPAMERMRRQGLTAKEQLSRYRVNQDLGGSVRVIEMPEFGGGPATVVPGSEATVGMSPADRKRIELERQRVGLEGRRVALAENRARQEAAATAATETAAIDPKIKAKREALFPKAQSAVERVERDIDVQIDRVRRLRNHPGLAGITGGVEGRLPSFTPNSTAAQSLLDNILAKGTLSSLTELRAASETGGALGNVSNQDTALLQNSVGALNQTQGLQSFQLALDEYISDLEFAKNNARKAFDATYFYRNAPAAKPPADDGDWSDL